MLFIIFFDKIRLMIIVIIFVIWLGKILLILFLLKYLIKRFVLIDINLFKMEVIKIDFKIVDDEVRLLILYVMIIVIVLIYENDEL